MMSAAAWAQCDPGTESCSITISGTDGYGDGWNGAGINIYQDSILRGTFTVTGSSTTQTFPACSGPVSFSWTDGTYDNECAFTITDSLGVVLYQCSSAGSLSGTFCNAYACPSCLPPVHLAATTTSDSAYISWSYNTEVTGWYYQYSVASYPSGNWTFTTDSMVVLSGLNPNTAYYFFAFSLCGVDDSSTISSLGFRTRCGDMALPIVEDFENGGDFPQCWPLWEHTSYTSYGYTYNYPQMYSYDAHSGTYLIEMLSDYGPNSIISPRVLLPANQIEVTFWAYGNYGSIYVGYSPTDDSATAVFNQVGSVTLTDSWQLYTVSFDNLTITDSVYVVLRVNNNPNYTYIYLDDITIRQHLTCPTADGLHMVATAPGQITFAWDDTTSTAWEIAYGPVGFNPDVDTVRVLVNSNPATVTGLSNTMTYDFYVRAVCGTMHGYWSQPATERPNVYNMPLSGSDTVYTCGMSIADPGGVAGVVDYYTNSTLVIYPDDSTQTVNLSGYAVMGSMTMDIYEGVGTSGRLLASLTGTNMYVNVSSSVGAITLDLHSSYYSADGFLFSTYCTPLPTCTDVYDVEIGNITGSSALVSWNYANFTTPEYFTIVAIDTAGDNELSYTAPDSVRSFTITGLSQLTDYIVYIQTTCNTGDTSFGIYTSFRTKCLSGGETLVGDPNTTASDYRLPFYPYYNGISQQLFDSTDLAGIDTIYGLMFYKASGSNGTRNLDVYVDTANITAYNSLTDYVAQTSDKKRYSGEFSIEDGWNEISFSTPFVYNGHNSLVLTFSDNTGTYGNTYYGLIHNTMDGKTLYGYNYNAAIDPSDPYCLSSLSYGASVLNFRNNITFLTPCGDASCVPPSVIVAGTDSGSVTLSWVPGLYESEWSVEYRLADDTNWQYHTYSTSLDTAIVSGLLPATPYVFRVGSLCGDTTAFATINATTACAPIRTLPFYEDFETFVADGYEDLMQQCWNRYTNYPSTYGSYYYPYIYTWYSHSGAQSMYFYASPDYSWCQLVLPEFAVPIDTLSLSFYMMGTYTSYYTYKAQIGVMTDPNNNSTFQIIDSVTFSLDDYEWEFCEVDLNGYTGSGGFLCIRTDPEVSAGFYIDDISLKYINPCKRVLNPTVSNATTTTATLSFIDTNNVGSYTILYGTSDSVAGATDTLVTTSTTVTLTGLTISTAYHAWVRANCPVGVADWVEFPTFRTRCNPIVVDDTTEYYTDFESGHGLDVCMAQERIIGKIDWEGRVAEAYSTGAAYSGGHLAWFGNTSREGITMLLLPNFDFSNLSRSAEMTFWHAQSANSGYQDALQVLYRTNDTAQWTVIDSFTQELTSWTQHYITLPNSAGNPYYQIALKAIGNMGGGIKLDDINVHASPTCARPYNITASGVTEQSAVLSWTGSAAAYTINYRELGSWSWHSTTSNSPSVVLTGLTNLTTYEVRIKGDCSRYDHSTWSELASFITNACVIPENHYNYDPANYTAAMSNYAPAYTYNNYTYSEVLVDSANLAGLNDIIAFGFCPTNSNARNAFEECDIYFGTTTDTVLNNFKFDTSFVLVYHGSLNYGSLGWNYYRLDSAYHYDGHSNLVVAINRHGSYTSYGDDTRFAGHVTGTVKNRSVYGYNAIDPATANLQPTYYITTDTVAPNYAFLSCGPYCYAPEITATAVTTDQATFTWASDGAEAEVSYREATAADWSAAMPVSGSTYTFTGLNHSTTYQLRVRQNCTADTLGFSNWTYTTVTTDPVCSVPTNLQATDLTNLKATLTWEALPTDDLFEVHVYGDEFDYTTRTALNTTVVRGLTAGKHYYAQVRTLCGPRHNTYGDYSDLIEFVTPICGPVAGLHGEANGNTIRLAWAEGINNAGFWEIQYGRPGFNESDLLGSLISPDTAFTIVNLIPNFTYAFRVRSLCGVAWESDWSTPELVVTTGDRIGIDDVDANFSCTIYPNPATDATTITVAGVEGRISISVVDVNGRTVANETLNCAADCEKKMDVSGLGQGAYFVHIVGDNVNSVRKLIVK